MRPAILLLLLFTLTLRCAVAGAGEQGAACPTLPQFQSLMARLDTMDPAASLTALDAYAANPANDNPNACEALELDSLITERERGLVVLAIGGREIGPGAVFHCNALQGRALVCNGTTEDGTAHPLAAGIRAEPLGHAVTATLVSNLPGMILQRLYLATTGGLLDGAPPKPLHADQSGFRLDPGSKANILIAIFRAPPPWRIRKFAWYFDLQPPASDR
jgi:hypothetical protein